MFYKVIYLQISRRCSLAKRILFVLLFISSTTYAAETQIIHKNKDFESGNYQLFQGTYSTFDLRRSETYSTSSVFLINTKTGEVKRYVNKIDAEGNYIEQWVPTEHLKEKK